MNQISLSERILAERSRNGLTQEELARRLGVSKAAVSKWECGQSMPDIALLPKIASLFSVTLDNLFGYEPMASEKEKEEVRARLVALLAEDPRRACDYAREQSALYWSDPELLRVVALALYAKSDELGVPDAASCAEAAPELPELTERILRRTLQLNPDDPSVDLTLQALCMLLASEGKDDQAVELVESMVPGKPSMAAITLAGIELRAGNLEAAARTLKRQLLFSLVEVASCAQALAGLPNLSMQDLEQLLSLAEGMWAAQGFASLSPTLAPFVRLAFATRLAEAGETGRALDELERFAYDLAVCCKTYESPQNPPFFECVRELLWQEGDERANAARNEAAASLRSTFSSSIASSESWEALREDPRFEALMRQIGDKGESR